MDFVHTRDSVKDWRFEGQAPNLLEVIENASATVLLGLSGQTGTFNQPVVNAMARNTANPMVFPLSNPTSASEALPEDVLEWSEGRAIVATGSPFDDVIYEDQTYPIGQGNNAFIFPGLGLGAILCEASEITDNMVLESAYALAEYTAAQHLASGLIYPPVNELQEVSIRVASRVIHCALKEGVAGRTDLSEVDCDTFVRSRFWHPHYIPFVKGTLHSD